MVQASTTSLALATIVLGGIFAYEVYRRQRLRTTCSLSDAHKKLLGSNLRVLRFKDYDLVAGLLDLGQKHLFENWPEAGKNDAEKKRLLEQLYHLNDNYVGGLPAYIRNARKLLRDSRDGKNQFDGFSPSVPQGFKLDHGSEEFQQLEDEGVAAAKHAAFVLVAGGLGERLGYSGIKVKLPVDSARNVSFLQEYIESILALQVKHDNATLLPFAIMTSGDTHNRTLAFLKENSYFGAKPSQVTLIKQEKVACLADAEGHLALEKEDPFTLQTKPHGHGDVHVLLHTSGLARKWRASGVQWVCFFQDTNGLVFRGLPAALGVSAREGYDVNSLAVPRKAQEAIGAITSLTHTDGRKMTINVEYNQLDPLLRATTHPEGDANDASGWSPFPGNINQLVLKLESYAEALERSKGIIAEFVNPKYKDSTKTEFKSATRLECMMQDFPKALPSSAAIGFTVINQVWAAYSPVKNSPKDAKLKAQGNNPSHSATTGELDVYQVNCRPQNLKARLSERRALQRLGASVAAPEQRTFSEQEVQLWPRVSWSPSFAITFSDLKAKTQAGRMRLGSDAVLVLSGRDIQIKSLELEGALFAEVGPRASLVIEGARVKNRGWAWQAVKEGPGKRPATEEEAIRGFLVCKREAESLVFRSGNHKFPAAATPQTSSAPQNGTVGQTPALA